MSSQESICDSQERNPSPDEIRRICHLIQLHWSEGERRRRIYGELLHHPKYELLIQMGHPKRGKIRRSHRRLY